MAADGNGYVPVLAGRRIYATGDPAPCPCGGLQPHRGPRQQRFARRRHIWRRPSAYRWRVMENPHVVDISSTRLRQQLLPEAGSTCRRRCTATSCASGSTAPMYGLEAPDAGGARPIALSFLKPKRMPHVLGTEQSHPAGPALRGRRDRRPHRRPPPRLHQETGYDAWRLCAAGTISGWTGWSSTP